MNKWGDVEEKTKENEIMCIDKTSFGCIISTDGEIAFVTFMYKSISKVDSLSDFLERCLRKEHNRFIVSKNNETGFFDIHIDSIHDSALKTLLELMEK